MPIDFDNDKLLAAEQVRVPMLWTQGRLRAADFSATDGRHKFGGPLALDLAGAPRDAHLHRLLTLSLADPLLGFSIPGVTALPLVYGFTHDGCRLRYRVESDTRIALLGLTPPSPSTDWPYRKYPSAFEEKRFALRDDGAVDPDQAYHLCWQGFEKLDPVQGVPVIVPPASEYGVSLWGDGDDELVQVVFEINPASREVFAYNQCT